MTIIRGLLGISLILISVVMLSVTILPATTPVPEIDDVIGSQMLLDISARINAYVKQRSSEAVYPSYSIGLCSSIPCEHGPAKLDPVAYKCYCPWASAEVMTEIFLWPDKKCPNVLDCRLPFKPVYDNTKDECVCSIQSLPPWGADHLVSYDPVDKFNVLQKSQKFYAWLDYSETRGGLKTTKSANKVIDLHIDRRQLSTTVGAVSQTPYPSYVPPPPIEVTQELLQKSMAIQPQKLGTVGSVIPHFAEGVITFFVQLQGPIPQTLVINATDTLPCDNIGAQPQPNIILVPQTVKNGIPQVTIPSCLVIAVNIYNPLWITYWVRKPDGSIYALTSDNKVHDVDQLDLGVPAAVAIRTTLTGGSTKRRSTKVSVSLPMKRHQVYQTPCGEFCPDPVMGLVKKDSSKFCGCVLNEANKFNLISRGVVEPNAYTATMTAQACAGITCINNGNQPAIYNPFSRTCWCAAPTYVENNPSADTPAM